jgi:predicted esterase
MSSNIHFGTSITLGGATDNLLLDFYQPSSDTAKLRPLVILVFGGGFETGDKSVLSALAKRFTAYGYATACTSYRLYDGANPISNVQLKKQILYDIQDIKATVRFFKKDAASTQTYKIDTNNIFLLGHSAGAMIVLHETYMNSLSKVMALDPNFATLINSYGGLEGNSGNPGYSSGIKGVINLSGGLLFKKYIQMGDLPGFHVYGTADNIMPNTDGILSLPTLSSIAISGPESLAIQSGLVGVTVGSYSIIGGDHFSPTTNNTAFTKMVGFLYQNL